MMIDNNISIALLYIAFVGLFLEILAIHSDNQKIEGWGFATVSICLAIRAAIYAPDMQLIMHQPYGYITTVTFIITIAVSILMLYWAGTSAQ